jgi:hypothetical protein
MNLGYESQRNNKWMAEKYCYIDDFYLKNGMKKTIKEISRKYGYTISAAAKLFHEVVG